MREQGIAAYAASDPKADSLVVEYAFLVKRIAHHLIARLPDSVQVDDLIQAGMIGLLEAGAKYEKGKGASFETYAGIRIRGSMLDEIRRGDWAPRSVHRNSRRITEAIRSVESITGREAVDKDVAASMGVQIDDYYRMLKDASGARLFSYEEVTEYDERADVPAEATVAERFEGDSFRRRLVDAIDKLPEREKLVLSLYYDEELNLKEIGAIIGVSESRVSQIMSQATLRLRSRLKEWLEND
jgi:RNA polymerase sigma factor for flagellar operon FliA